MGREETSQKNRVLEFVLWGAVILAGGYVLLPAAVDLVQTRQQEAKEQADAATREDQLREEQQRLDLHGKDPDAARKKAELLGLQARKDNLEEETHD
ncbi:MAG: hypothetical protein O3A95_05050 [Planctomycetota bacterium]|nr:hypothetical protein [Planctomycetota bacterium]MDA1113652.1 hypothetical protein [Planctomycetota bacterium]